MLGEIENLGPAELERNFLEGEALRAVMKYLEGPELPPVDDRKKDSSSSSLLLLLFRMSILRRRGGEEGKEEEKE
jgi:hypothetical protein